MKKRFFLALACAAMMLPASAQWTPGDNNLAPIDTVGGLEYSDPIMLRKADGSTIMAYETYGTHVNPATGQADTAKFFYLHLQMLDPIGNKQWGEQGVIVSSKPTDLASFGDTNLDTLPNGNILLTHEDARNLEQVGGNLTHSNFKDTKVFAYCYDQQGQSVWSEDGVMLPYYHIDSTAKATMYVGEQIALSGENIYLAAVILVQYTRPDPHTLVPVDTYVHYFEVACYDFNGNKIGERLDSVNSAFTFSLAPAPDGDAYVVYVNDIDGYSAQRIGSDCQNKWANAPVIETKTVVSREQTGAYAIPPYKVIPISDGSVGIVYKAFISVVWSSLFYNRLYPDGSVLDDHVVISDTTGVQHDCYVMVEGDTLTIFENYMHNRTQEGEYYLYLNRIKLDGTYLLPNSYGYWLDENKGVDSRILCMTKADENYNVIVCSAEGYSQTYQSYCYTISPDGKMFQRKPVIGEVYMTDIDCIVENNYAYIVFAKNELGKGGIWMSCIDATDYTNSVELTGELPGKFTVGPDGKQVNFSKGNLNYLPYRQTYKFAASQHETHNGFNHWITETSLDWQDLFGWGTGDHASKVDTADTNYDIYTDWGNNPILNSTYEPGTWRAMTKEEWNYLLNVRENAAQKRAVGQIAFHSYVAANGLIILPDTFEMPQGLQIDVNAHEYSTNSYMINAWLRMEDAGAVFIPAGGYRTGINVHDIDDETQRGINGYYWTATPLDAVNAESMIFTNEGPVFILHPRADGFSVRLVKDVDDPQGFDETIVNRQSSNRKFIKDGQLYIIRDERIYNATGVRVK